MAFKNPPQSQRRYLPQFASAFTPPDHTSGNVVLFNLLALQATSACRSTQATTRWLKSSFPMHPHPKLNAFSSAKEKAKSNKA
ncbi:hypothetical protein M378DRAFT_167009 [Amanita muscaria Koide BX008]|uniref:Uncharacterized protein n=1 Tax=Amanita muscaria (strain Koide BX008) TaxID=946122 RepID=A0A0C2T4A7_AMAMK|nr:hypothetical protein M378DRAFT_167009 [Amanita muscaria Koide BX008]